MPVVLVEEDSQQEMMSFVGENGRVYFSGLPKKGLLRAKWTMNGQPMEADFIYQLPDSDKHEGDFEFIPQVHLVESEKI